MDELERLNTIIIGEADRILHDYGLLAVLNKYGNPVVWGSYVLELMTWRDLDIYLEANEMTETKFFQLGRDIAQCLKPHRMQYRNEFVGKTPGQPVGFYWGIYTNALKSPDVWKIDIWSIDSRQLELYQKEFDVLKSRINKDNRPIILSIKHHYCKHTEYRRGFTSRDIYYSVIEEGVKSVKEFSQWLQDNKQIT